METKKIGEIREEFKAAEETMLPSFIEKYRSDERAGVQKLIEQANGRLAKLEAERARIDRLWKYEREYGMYTRICGIDEVGERPGLPARCAGAVILPKDCRHPLHQRFQEALGGKAGGTVRCDYGKSGGGRHRHGGTGAH